MATGWRAFAGTYTDGESEGVYSCTVDAETGALSSTGATEAGQDPSFLALHPSGEYLYAVNETDGVNVGAFEIDGETGGLTPINRVASGDVGPCFCSVDATGRYLLIAHYHGDSVSMLPLGDDGGIGKPSDVVHHEGSGPHERQDGPYPHSIRPGPDNEFAYAADLGTDEVVAYEMDLDAGELRRDEAASVEFHGGAGPRHMDFHPDGERVYVIDELDSTMTTLERDTDTGELTVRDTVTTLPEDFDGDNKTADVHVHPSGEWVYGSNRGHDSIAVFGVDEDTGELRPRGHESTRGEWPRHFAVTPSGDHLLAENMHSSEIVTFEIGTDGSLEPTGSVTDLPDPVCLQILEMA